MLKKLTLIFFSLFFTSCSSLSASDWSEWERCGVSQEEMTWDLCRESLHGEKYHHKGWCYPALECRHRRTMWPFRNKKTQERTVMLFCGWGDIPCYQKYGFFNKELK